ncbi:ABC transporter permease [Janibacter cremeus]|uniref:ABC transporter permease n=1 Tax=Janibacter cremeus TaxID=1285192 RepID=UPI0023F77BE9|nr:ABC transporter permease [Janibacter cremeus]WEV77396.1 ABC transporter permease [Janibacter cremeus]
MPEIPTPTSSHSRVTSTDDSSHRTITDSGQPADPATPPTRTTLRSRFEPGWLHVLTSRYGLIGVWAVMVLVYAILMPTSFWNVGALSSIFGSQSVLVFLALSAMTTLIVGEFDLSIASVMGMTATTVAVLGGVHGWPIGAAVAAAVVVALVAGLANAFFVVFMDLSSLVVTLGMATLLTGLTQMISGSNIVSVNSRGLAALVGHDVLGLPLSFYYGLALAVLIAYVLGWTPLGRGMLFIGSNPEVARLAGIRVNRVRVGAYLAGALMSGLSGIILVGSVGGVDPSTTMTFLLPALAAVFLGTAVVQPGRFNPIGTMIAIYFLTTGIFGLQLLGFSGWIQNVFYGGGLVVAVALAKIIRSRTTTA